MISFRERDPLKVGAVCLVVVAVLLGTAFSFSSIRSFLTGYVLYAEFADAAGLQKDNEVRIAGLKVGKVKSIQLKKDRVLVEMAVEEGIYIPAKATAEISLGTILGTKFVAIDAREKGAPLEDGDLIPLRRTAIPFEIYQITKQTVGLISEIDAAKLNSGFRALADLSEDPQSNIASTLKGGADVAEAVASQTDTISSLIEKGEALVSELDRSSPEILAIISNSNTILDVLSRRRAALRSLIRNTDLLASSVGGLVKDNRNEIDRVLRDLHATLLIVDANLSQLEEAIRLLGPSSESLGRILWTGRWANVCIAAIEAAPTLGIPTAIGTGPEGPKGCDPAGAGG